MAEILGRPPPQIEDLLRAICDTAPWLATSWCGDKGWDSKYIWYSEWENQELRLRVRIPSRYPDFVHQIHTIRLIQLRCRYKCCTKFNPTLFWPSGLDMSTSSFPLRANPNIASSTWFSTAIIPPVLCFIPKYHGLWVWGGWTKAVLQKKHPSNLF